MFHHSELSSREYVELRATLKAMDDARFRCGDCGNQYRSRPDSEKIIAAFRASKACEVVAEKPVQSIDELQFLTCLGNFFSHSAARLVEMHAHFERGVMPYPGSLADQPSKVIDAFRIIGNWKMRRQAEEAEKARKEAKKKRGR